MDLSVNTVEPRWRKRSTMRHTGPRHGREEALPHGDPWLKSRTPSPCLIQKAIPMTIDLQSTGQTSRDDVTVVKLGGASALASTASPRRRPRRVRRGEGPRALLKHKVLFFRGQDHLDDDGQHRPSRARSARHRRAPDRARAGSTQLLELDATKGRPADSWHTDVTFVDAVPEDLDPARRDHSGLRRRHRLGQHRRGLRAPARPSCKQLADTLWAVHSNDYDYAADRVRGRGPRAPDATTARCSSRRCTRPSIRWCTCTRRPASARCCSATS